jgi:hypothetical protein
MNRPRLAIVSLAFGVLLGAGCIQIVQQPTEPEIEVRTPKPFTSENHGKLEPTELKGLFQVPELDKACYYYEPKKEWYRFSYNRWFQAFRWDGAWFELRDEDVPKFLQGRVQIVEGPTKKKRLEELDKKLEEIDKQERLEQLEKQMKDLDEQEQKQAPAQPAPAQEPQAPAPK